jgi:hypothetical protein
MSRALTGSLLELAQHVAIRFALERYERGEVRINAIVELLDRMKREMRSLRDVLRVHEDKMGRAGLEVEAHTDILDRQFWAGLPESAKRKILLSAEAWAIPPRSLRQLVEQLLERHDAELARSILPNYAACIQCSRRPLLNRSKALGMLT